MRRKESWESPGGAPILESKCERKRQEQKERGVRENERVPFPVRSHNFLCPCSSMLLFLEPFLSKKKL